MKKASTQDHFNDTFPRILRNLMEKEHTRQAALADYCGVQRQSISQWQNGNTRPDIDSLKKIAQFYSVSTDYLLGIVDYPTKDKDLSVVCEYTGLSQDAIANIRQNKSDLTSAFLESEEFSEIIRILSNAKRYRNLLSPCGEITAISVIAKAGLNLVYDDGLPSNIDFEQIPPVFKQALSSIVDRGLSPMYKQELEEQICSLYNKFVEEWNNG